MTKAVTTTDLRLSRAAPTGEHGDVERDDAPRDPDADDRLAKSGWMDRWRERWANELWPTALLFAVLASASTLTSSAGDYVGDNRFEQYWNPARRIARSLTIWDGSRGLGRVREDFWPGTTVPIAVFRGVGFSPALAEALFHAMCLTLAAVGMVLVVRLFRPRIGLEHFLAGCVMAFGAYSATFLVPSNLYFQYALAPWLFVVAYRGMQSDRPWRWAAAFALLVFLAGNTDLPGLVYNCVPLVSVTLYLLFVERSVRLPNALAWFARALVLSLWVSAAAVAKVYFAAAALGQRLNDTEAAEVAALTSSWPESLRGLGNWLSYFSDGQMLLKPQGAGYFTNWVVVGFTFVPPCIALFVLWHSRLRSRILFSMTMIASLVILVGGFPKNNPSPLGSRILSVYTSIRALAAFRNTYKIGAGLVIGVAALFAYGIVLAVRRLSRERPGLRFVPIAFAFTTIIVVAYPFWTGGLYDPAKRLQKVPAYWGQTFDHLGQMPIEGRSLVLPQTSRTRYRWGWVGDDIFDALDPRDHAVATGVPLSTPIASSALESITLMGAEPMYVPGVLGPMARRLGITEIVLRNDLDWQSMDRPRPAAFDGLRRDPDFERVASFGAPGENTTARADSGPLADRDRSLPPVEIYAVRNPRPTFDVVAPGPALLLSGDGFAWPGLASAGLLDDPRPLTYTGDLNAEQLTHDLEAGSPLVISDANRRRLRVLLSYEPDYSYALGDGQELDRPTQSLWKELGSQSVTWYPDASSIAVSGPPRSVGGTQVWNRPANAFDGNVSTAWQIRRTDPQARVFRIELRKPTEVSQATIVLPGTAAKSEGITRATLRFSDGPDVEVKLGKGRTEVRFDARRTQWIEFVPEDLSDNVATIGVAEIAFPGIDLREFVQTPDDVFRQAQGDERLAAALRQAPTGYVFSRTNQHTSKTTPPPALAGADTTAEETALRRRFASMGEQVVDVTGSLHIDRDTPDQTIDAILGGDHGAFGSSRQGAPLAGFGGNAVDGDPNTAWFGRAAVGETLTFRFPKQVVRNVIFDAQNDGVSSRINAVDVQVGDRPPMRDVKTQNKSGACLNPEATVAKECDRRLDLDVEPVETDHLTITITNFTPLAKQLSPRVRIDELRINNQTNKALFNAGSSLEGCRDLGLKIEGSPGELVPLPVRIEGSVVNLLGAQPTPFAGCQPVKLTEGWHRFESANNTPVDRAQLLPNGLGGPNPSRSAGSAETPGSSSTAPANTETVSVVSRSATRIQLSIPDNRPGSVLLFDQSWDPRWQASVNGKPLAEPRDFNTVNGWVLPDAGSLEIELRYKPQTVFGFSLIATMTGVVACAWLTVRRPRQTRPGRPPPVSPEVADD